MSIWTPWEDLCEISNGQLGLTLVFCMSLRYLKLTSASNWGVLLLIILFLRWTQWAWFHTEIATVSALRCCVMLEGNIGCSRYGPVSWVAWSGVSCITHASSTLTILANGLWSKRRIAWPPIIWSSIVCFLIAHWWGLSFAITVVTLIAIVLKGIEIWKIISNFHLL